MNGPEAKHLGATLGTDALRHPETGEWIIKLPARFERVLGLLPDALTDEARETLRRREEPNATDASNDPEV